MTGEKKQILTVKNIRNVNIENILHTLLRMRSVTRSTLAAENHISLMTVKHIVDSLVQADIIEEQETDISDVGRKPKLLTLAEHYGNIVCVNLASREEISYLIYDIYEKKLAEQTILLQNSCSYQNTLKSVIEALKTELSKIATDTVGVAVFVPSAYDEEKDQVNYDLISDFKDLKIKKLFEDAFEIENILILHDVFAAARSEYDCPAPKQESQFYFYCGYGVGGFFIHKDDAVAGEERMAGEVGKILVSMDGSRNESTILEEVISISAVKNRMKKLQMEGTFEDLLENYKNGAVLAKEILDPVFGTISRVLYNLLWVYNPTKVVIDSCENDYSCLIAEHFKLFLSDMHNEAIPIHVQIKTAKYDEYHMMHGCFKMARNSWIEKVAGSL